MVKRRLFNGISSTLKSGKFSNSPETPFCDWLCFVSSDWSRNLTDREVSLVSPVVENFKL